MEFIQNTGPGTRLDQLNKAAVKEAESIIAAVAYVTDIQTLITTCWKHQKPLILFARYDYSCPVSEEALQWFLAKSTESANYEMRLVADIFHPKVICLLADGQVCVGLGSANLTSSGMAENLEAWAWFNAPEDHPVLAGVRRFLQEMIQYLKI